MWELKLPTDIQMTSKKKFYLNLNVYRNTHHHILSDAKVKYSNNIKPMLLGIPPQNQVEIEYTLFCGSNLKKDISNVCSIVDKFFCDSLVRAGIIEDDTYEYVTSVTYKFGGVIKGDPHVIARIIPVNHSKSEPKKENSIMQITIAQNEIEEAIREYINRTVLIREGAKISVELNATRGSQGFTAVIDIEFASGLANKAQAMEPRVSHTQITQAELPFEAQETPKNDKSEETITITTERRGLFGKKPDAVTNDAVEEENKPRRGRPRKVQPEEAEAESQEEEVAVDIEVTASTDEDSDFINENPSNEDNETIEAAITPRQVQVKKSLFGGAKQNG